jgi:hypothetical protein
VVEASAPRVIAVRAGRDRHDADQSRYDGEQRQDSAVDEGVELAHEVVSDLSAQRQDEHAMAVGRPTLG